MVNIMNKLNLLSAIGILWNAAALRQCTRLKDMKYAYGECDEASNTAKLHLYYDDPECAPVRTPNNDGPIGMNGSTEVGLTSEAPPSYLTGYECHHMCEKDGMYSTIKYEDELQQVCKACP